MSQKLKITLTRSLNGTVRKQRDTARALGLGKMGSSHILPDRPEIQGMLRVVKHLVTVHTVKG